MELYKLSTRIRSDIEQALSKDLENLVDALVDEFNIVSKTSGEPLKRRVLVDIVNKYTKIQTEHSKTTHCQAICLNGNRCVWKTIPETHYCKRHIGLSFRQNEQLSQFYLLETNQQLPTRPGLETKLIEDTFYDIDDTFIYDKNSGERVGYISKGEYILTNDPFELGTFDDI
jgi:hypothetical protein